MPWRETSPMDQKTQFIADYLRETLSVCELCDRYGISRKTAYKGIDRYLKHGPAGLHDRSRKPGSSPHHTPEQILAALLQARSRHPTWGAKKLLPLLAKRFPAVELPSRTTVFDLLGRHGMLATKRQRRRIGHPGAPTSTILAPHDGWSADFKGQFKTGDGRSCSPLTVTDGSSRDRLGCQALGSTAVHEATPVLSRRFKECGLPKGIRTDNGGPLATNTRARLSSLSAWWVRLGVRPECIEPGKPPQNGRHEPMHRTLTAETTRPPAPSLRAPPRKFKRFRNEDNTERPHAALDRRTPDQRYSPSPRPMPHRLPALEYPDRFEVR
jgi:putative transposase